MSAKIFAGYALNSETKMHLAKSFAWKQITILPVDETQNLIEISHEGKNYLGCYLKKKPTLDEIRKLEGFIAKQMKKYCPDLLTENFNVSIFAQIFLA